MDFVTANMEGMAQKFEGNDPQRVKEAQEASWTRLNDHRYAQELRERVKNNPHLSNITDIALEHIGNITAQANSVKHRQLKGKTDHQKDPLLVISMGGAGTGKSGAETMIHAATYHNYVEASLDKFRNDSAIYHVLQAANHHADDYAIVEPFAAAIREWVSKGAIEGGYNLLYDGTSIPFAKRYDNLLTQAKQKKQPYTVVVAGYDTLLVEPEGQEGAIEVPAYKRVCRNR
jgi:hypothetical protein